jgi:hypothetical protein
LTAAPSRPAQRSRHWMPAYSGPIGGCTISARPMFVFQG